MSKFRLQFQDQEKSFEIARQGNDLRVEWDGQTAACKLTYAENGFFVLEVEEADGSRRQIRAAGAVDGEGRQLWVDGRITTFHRVRQRRRSEGNEGSLTATIPAIVTQILVSPGDVVAAGKKLILLESMKMIIPIQAPYTGRVTAIRCAEGDSVQAGVQLIELTKVEE